MNAESALVVWILLGALFLGAGAVVEIWSRAYRRWRDQDGDWYEEGKIRW